MISTDDILTVGLGLAGASHDFGREMLFKSLDNENLTKRTILCSDAEAAFKILCPLNYGIMLSVGTGIICYGKDINGKSYRTAGLGHGIDKGSAYWIGEQLLWQLSLNESAEISDFESIELAQILSKKVNMLFNSWVGMPSKLPLNQLLNWIPFLAERIRGFKKFSQNCL